MTEEEVENVEIMIRQEISFIVEDGIDDLEKVVEKAIRTLVYDETRRRPRVFVTVNTI